MVKLDPATLYTTRQAAAYCGVSVETIKRDLYHTHKLTGLDLAGARRFTRKELDAYKITLNTPRARAAKAAQLHAAGQSLTSIADALGYKTSSGALKAIQRHTARLLDS